jgi:hypothetical protein
MANTFTLIASTTVGSGGASTISFSSIPQTYTDLVIKMSVRGTGAVVNRNILISFNGSSSNFTMRNAVSEGGTLASYTQGAYGGTNPTGYNPGNTATASTFGSADFYFPNYTSNNNKSVSVDSVGENNNANGYLWLSANLWSSSSAITSLTFTEDANNFAEFSTAYLYGIKKD